MTPAASALGARLRAAAASRADRLRIAVAAGLLGVYLAAVLVITLTPAPVDRPFRGSLARLIQELHERGVPAWIGYGEIEFTGNVLLFVPAGFLAALVLARRDWWIVAVAAPVFSALIEFAQALFLTERFPTVSDIVANSVGGAFGAALALLARLLVHRRDRLLADDLASGRRTLKD
ncbi:VanZ family protein [Naasia sp. SYSU D00057]|uniref:VanZ family protein n=1 Tax=Naasia sp. SYSU D00057 TaxID=2817380 RepID=UPI001B3021A5|nr:VanZ family protein [Naasia sp. SYSU D00057]